MITPLMKLLGIPLLAGLAIVALNLAGFSLSWWWLLAPALVLLGLSVVGGLIANTNQQDARRTGHWLRR